MKQLIIPLTIICLACASVPTCADDKVAIPKLEELNRIVGIPVDSDEFRKMLTNYGFGENPKRENSWGSAFGVFFEITKDRIVVVGIRPQSTATNMPTYPGELPRKLKAADSIATIESKLGKPQSSSGNPQEQYVMQYEGLNVVTLSGQLFEVWLTPTSAIAKDATERKQK